MTEPQTDNMEELLSKSFLSNDGRFDPKAANAMLGSIGHSGLLGIDYVDHGGDWVELSMDWREDLIADEDDQLIASSAVITLIDNACSMAVWTKLGFFRPQVTMDLRLDYLRPSPPGERIYGRGVCYHMTTNVGFVRGIAHNGDSEKPVAYAAGTFVRVRGANMART